MKGTCANCRFAHPLPDPGPEPEVPPYVPPTGFWGWLLGKEECAVANFHRTRDHDNWQRWKTHQERFVRCRRFPEEETTAKTYACGEWAEEDTGE